MQDRKCAFWKWVNWASEEPEHSKAKFKAIWSLASNLMTCKRSCKCLLPTWSFEVFQRETKRKVTFKTHIFKDEKNMWLWQKWFAWLTNGSWWETLWTLENMAGFTRKRIQSENTFDFDALTAATSAQPWPHSKFQLSRAKTVASYCMQRYVQKQLGYNKIYHTCKCPIYSLYPLAWVFVKFSWVL